MMGLTGIVAYIASVSLLVRVEFHGHMPVPVRAIVAAMAVREVSCTPVTPISAPDLNMNGQRWSNFTCQDLHLATSAFSRGARAAQDKGQIFPLMHTRRLVAKAVWQGGQCSGGAAQMEQHMMLRGELTTPPDGVLPLAAPPDPPLEPLEDPLGAAAPLVFWLVPPEPELPLE